MNGHTMHRPVMEQEVVTGLNIKPDGVYVDATFGRGGHAQQILARLSPKGLLVVLDQDPEAIAHAKWLFHGENRVIVVHANFIALSDCCRNHGINTVDGILLDLGVSSPQLDNGERGFSFQQDGPLDMRMNNTRGESVADWLAVASVTELVRVIKGYGEERYAKKIANKIIEAREKYAITTTLQLAELIKSACPKGYGKGRHPATKSFQAFRIFINQELSSLELALPKMLDLLAITGRIVIISFHSLEDKIVKSFIKKYSEYSVASNYLLRKVPFPVKSDEVIRLKNIGKYKATASELNDNPRSRSAIMRVAEKCA